MGPQLSPDRGQGIGEGDLRLGVPRRSGRMNTMTAGMSCKDQANHHEQAQDARGGSQHRGFDPLTRALKSQVGTALRAAVTVCRPQVKMPPTISTTTCRNVGSVKATERLMKIGSNDDGRESIVGLLA